MVVIGAGIVGIMVYHYIKAAEESKPFATGRK